MMAHQAKLASMGEMIGNIAHQWRQPLNLLNISVMKFLMTYKPEKTTKSDVELFVAKINNVVQAMSTTIDDFRNFFIPDKTKHDFDIKTTIDESIKFLEESYKVHGVQIINNSLEGIVCNGYKNELIQVLMILFNNSLDAYKSKKGDDDEHNIVIDSKYHNGIITMIIKDKAGGISNDVINRVFEPYFTTKFKANGTGIGLYMAKMIIEESMSGKISIINEDNGVKVTIKLSGSINLDLNS